VEDLEKPMNAERQGQWPHFSFNLDGPTNTRGPKVVIDEEDNQESTTTAKLLHYHQRFDHVSFAKLQLMAKQGVLPKDMAKCPNLVCMACMFAHRTNDSLPKATIS
jgi:hypothetical protein